MHKHFQTQNKNNCSDTFYFLKNVKRSYYPTLTTKPYIYVLDLLFAMYYLLEPVMLNIVISINDRPTLSTSQIMKGRERDSV